MAEEVSFIEPLLRSRIQFVPDLQVTLTEAAGQIFFFLRRTYWNLPPQVNCSASEGKSEQKKNQEIWLPGKFLCLKEAKPEQIIDGAISLWQTTLY